MSDIHTLSGAYVVDAVDEEERHSFEQHLASCPDCRVEVRSLRETAALLASLEPFTAPSPQLRDRVFAEIATVRPLPPEVRPVSAEPPLGAGTPVPIADARERRSRRLALALTAAAAAVVVAGTGVAVWQSQQSGEGTVPPSRTLTAEERVLQAPDAREVALELGEARATVVHSRELGQAVIITEAMPTAPTGQVYELWWETPEGGMEPAGLMPRAEDQTFVLQGDGSQATAVGITVEPAGGSPEPTSDPIALFEL